jgi:MFS family permease
LPVKLTPQYWGNNRLLVALYAALVTFLTYAVVYAFRKPFSAATFDGLAFAGISYKVCLVISQALGYTLSKFYGIKFIAGLKRYGRWKVIALLISIAWLALLFFAMIPTPFNIIFLFINGFPLGMIWGIVFSYIEGRRATDFIGAVLAVSFIFSSGFVKSVAKYILLHWGVTEFWSPFITGLVFIIPLVLLLFLLEKIPAPAAADIATRKERRPMTKTERQKLIAAYFPGLVTLIVIYTFLTIFRDIRDNFAADIWKELGYASQAGVFTNTEIPVTLLVLGIMASLVFVKNNFTAFMASHMLIAAGFLISGASTYFFMQYQLTAFNWMLLVGLGLYTAYIPFNCIVFERLFAAFKLTGNVGFFMYLADSFGYLGSILVLVVKEVFTVQLHWVSFYSQSVLVLSVLGIAGTLASSVYFIGKHKKSVTVWSNVQPSL